ncbi:MAG: Fic family protein, partial [Lacisediminimonas sp.]|nr:Fic family protein [Lacisediminimonas sp.]
MTEQADLDDFEAISVTQRSEEPLPEGRFTPAHYFAVHRHLFQDVYPWAGKPRSVRTGKAGAWFCFPENIAGELKRVFAEL